MYNFSTYLTALLKKLYPELSFPQFSETTEIEFIVEELNRAIRSFRLDRERIFIELWWSGNIPLQTIGSYLLPEIIEHSGRQSSNIINETIKHLHDPKLVEFLAINLAEIIKNDFESWAVYLNRLTRHSNPMVHCLISQTIVYLTRKKINFYPQMLVIIERLMHTGNIRVQECVSWSLVQLSFQWPEIIRKFIITISRTGDQNFIQIICKAAMGFGSWIIPVLAELENNSDQDIRCKVKKTLTILNQMGYRVSS